MKAGVLQYSEENSDSSISKYFCLLIKGSSIQYIRTIFWKYNISNYLIRTCTCGYQGWVKEFYIFWKFCVRTTLMLSNLAVHNFKVPNQYSSRLLILLHFSTASVIPAESKPWKIRYLRIFRYSNICTIHLAYGGFTSDSFSVTSTSAGFFLSFSWFTTCSANHLL